MAFIESGYLEYEELCSLKPMPTQERYEFGPVAIAECVQNIPCNPCETACKTGALKVGDPITNLPVIDYQMCTGCGLCVAKCPGMAIFIVNKSYSNDLAMVSFPYEYYPVPQQGDQVEAVDRTGTVCCTGTVVKVLDPKAFDHTPVVTIEIPKQWADQVRSIKRGGILK